MRAVLALFALAGSSVALAPQDHGRAKDTIDPAAIFASRCSNCHAIPDPQLPTDRAWLGQIARTA